MAEMLPHPGAAYQPRPYLWLGLSLAGVRAGSPAPSGASRRLLLIEDDLAIAEMYRLQLQLDGYDVAVVNDGQQGLQLMRAMRPDLVLLDVQLPGISGFEFLESVSGEPQLKQTPIVVLSNYGDPGMVERGRSLGAADYLVKAQTPPAAVSATVAKWLGRGTLPEN